MTLFPGADNERKITGPWFIFHVGIVNSTLSDLVVATLDFKVSGRKNGALVKSEGVFDPSSTCDDSTAARVYLARIPPSGRYANLTDYCNENSVVPTPPGVTPVVTRGANGEFYEDFYIDSLPEADDFFYAVDINATGWFEDEGVAIERLVVSGQLFTQ